MDERKKEQIIEAMNKILRNVLTDDGRTRHRPDVHDTDRTNTTPTGRTMRRPTGRTMRQPTGQTMRRPTGQTMRRPTGRTMRRPTGRTMRRPTGALTVLIVDAEYAGQPDPNVSILQSFKIYTRNRFGGIILSARFCDLLAPQVLILRSGINKAKLFSYIRQIQKHFCFSLKLFNKRSYLIFKSNVNSDFPTPIYIFISNLLIKPDMQIIITFKAAQIFEHSI